MLSRYARLGRTIVRLDYDDTDPVVSRIAQTVLPDGSVDLNRSECIAYALLPAGTERVTLRRESTLMYDGVDAARAASILLDDLTRALITDCHEGMVFHAAALARGDAAVLLPGSSGTGKTTLALWLSTRGLIPVNDEVALVDRDGDQVQTFSRALAIKPGGLDVLRRSMALDETTCQIRSSGVTLISPASLGVQRTLRALPLAAVVFPLRRPGPAALQPLSPAEVAFALMTHLVNAANLPGGGFTDVVRLARRTSGCRLLYEDVDDLADGALTTWLASAPLRAASLRPSPCS